MKKIKTPLIAIGLAVGFCLSGSNRLKAQDFWVCAGNDATSKYEVYDPAVTDWNSGNALVWSFGPTTAGGWTSTEVAAYSNPSDMKLRYSGPNLMVATCASGGLATIANYPSGTMWWTLNIGGSYNLHSVEILPQYGNIAIAASDGNWVRVYTSGQGGRSSNYAQYNLTGAHAVLWDPQNNVLWALGTSVLVKLSIGGTATSPTITQVDSINLPATAGHDLSPYSGDPDKLWLTVSLNVYIYSKSAKTFTGAPGSANRSAVKGCGNEPSGEIVQCQQDNSECTLNTWCTPHVNFFTSSGSADFTRTRTGAAFYKCRLFTSDYQPWCNPPYTFDWNQEGWYSANGLTPMAYINNSTWPHSMYCGQIGNTAYMNGPVCSFAGLTNDVVSVNLYAQNGTTSAHDAQLLWTTPSQTWTLNLASPLVQYTLSNNWTTLNFDVNNTNWIGQTITGLRVCFDQTNHSNTWIINDISVGQNVLPAYGFDSNTMGWYAGYNVDTVNWAGPGDGWPGCIYFDQTGTPAYIYGPPTLDYLGETNDTVQIHVYPQSGNTASHEMRVYFTSWADGTWNDSKSTTNVPYTAQNGWATVNIPIGNNTNWSGQWIKQLRLDVDDNNNSGARFIIDSINVIP